MSDPQTFEMAQDAVKKILETLQVQRVVCVDDYYDTEPTIQEIVVAARRLDKEVLDEIFLKFDVGISSDPDVLKEQIQRLWETIDKPNQMELAEKILAAVRIEEDAVTDDPGDASLLSELIPQEMLLPLSPKQWEDRADHLLKEDAEQRTLFLFDQDFSGIDSKAGIKIISSLLARNDTGNLICGLLTHTISPADQMVKWMELTREYHIPPDRFLVVPKLYISQEPILFAQTLKLVALSPDFSQLKQKTKKIIEDAALIAAERVDVIDIYDFDHVVLKVSAEEGLWEPDMLFRLHALFHRLESHRLAHDGDELESIVRRLRSLNDIPTEGSFLPAHNVWHIQKQELYESREHVNNNHLPLELGDIFVKTGGDSTKRYILLAQPCDLMVRTKGKRKPEISFLPLAEVVKGEPDSAPKQYVEELSYFGDNPNEHWYVKLKNVHQVRSCVLDLCVLNTDGSSTIQIGGEPSDRVRPYWKSRYKLLSDIYKRMLKPLDRLTPVAGESVNIRDRNARLKADLSADILNATLFRGALTEAHGKQVVTFNCQRVGRLYGARAFGLLMAYTSCLGRPAYDRDFG